MQLFRASIHSELLNMTQEEQEVTWPVCVKNIKCGVNVCSTWPPLLNLHTIHPKHIQIELSAIYTRDDDCNYLNSMRIGKSTPQL